MIVDNILIDDGTKEIISSDIEKEKLLENQNIDNKNEGGL